jgi:prephenate dehydratase
MVAAETHVAAEARWAVGTLGGPGTFAAQATEHLRAQHAWLGDVTYYAAMEEGWAALEAGAVDAIVFTAETDQTGFNEVHARVAAPGSRVYVVAEAQVPYACSLLAKPGTRLADVREVIGHGSIRQCRAWLAAHLPDARIVTHGQNSMAAAREVAAGDGTLVVVGTRITAELNGLAELAANIDGGSLGNWWTLALRPRYSEAPDRLIVAARCDGAGALGDLIASLTTLGHRLRTVYARPSGVRLFEYDYVLALTGAGGLAAVEAALAAFPGARLAGAFAA